MKVLNQRCVVRYFLVSPNLITNLVYHLSLVHIYLLPLTIQDIGFISQHNGKAKSSVDASSWVAEPLYVFKLSYYTWYFVVDMTGTSGLRADHKEEGEVLCSAYWHYLQTNITSWRLSRELFYSEYLQTLIVKSGVSSILGQSAGLSVVCRAASPYINISTVKTIKI